MLTLIPIRKETKQKETKMKMNYFREKKMCALNGMLCIQLSGRPLPNNHKINY